jgi:O-succinylbenzoic acid--CoA ligase
MERSELRRRLGVQPTGARAAVCVRESDPERFRAAFAAAVAGEGEVFLANPTWTAEEMAHATRLMATPSAPKSDRGWLMIPTGGSSGLLKFARHDGHSLAAAVRGFVQHFALAQVNALGALPLFHVSGLMAWMRCVMTGGEYRAGDWKQLEAGEWPELPADRPWVTSLVPTQLERLLRAGKAVDRLRRFHVIFLGGAPAGAELLDEAAHAGLPLSLSYGMTETAAMITALRPGEFLAGERSSGAALPHARVELSEEGVIRIGGSSLFRGYFPEWRHERKFFETADLGAWSGGRRLQVLGRRDAAIITGGEKVQPAEVEATLRVAAGTGDFAVIGLPDAEWGERVVCVFSAAGKFDVARARAALERLSAPQRPKDFIALPEWPRNDADKLNRARLRDLALGQLRTGAKT